jgi:hypothetical protein
MTPETIAAEVQARYGVPVQPDAVKIIPQGHMATAVNYRWDGFQLKNIESTNPLRDAKNAMWKNAQRSKRLTAAPKEPKIHPQIIKSQERQAETAALVAKGYDCADLAAHYGCTENQMRKFCNKWKIKVTRKPSLSGRAARRDERRAKVMEFPGAGDKTIRQIADYLGCTWSAAQNYCTARKIPYRVKRGNAAPLTGPGALEPLPANGGM